MTTTRGGQDSRWPHPERDTATTHVAGHGVGETHERHGGHGLMMMICCIPMIVIAVLLVATGIAGSDALLWALGCVAMMAVMMFAMGGGHDHE